MNDGRLQSAGHLQPSPRILLRGGRLLDPATGRDEHADIAVADGSHSVILPQVTFGIAVRMAVMSILAGNDA